jgi:hypothetical protein
VDLPSAIGLGLDIAGATIIAIGLLGNPATLALRATTFWGGNPPSAVREAENRADAEFGIPTVVCGFTGQLVGLGVHSEASHFVGYGSAAAAALIPLVAWYWLWRPWRAKKVAIEIAHYRVENSTSLPVRSDRPTLERLVSMGSGFGAEQRDGESDEAYVERAFGVTDAIPRPND